MFKNVQDQSTHLMPIITDFLYGRPVIVHFIQIVPAHLVYTDREDAFKMWIYAFANQLAEQQFIDKKSGGVGKITNQRMTYGNRFNEKSVFMPETCDQLLIGDKGIQDIVAQA